MAERNPESKQTPSGAITSTSLGQLLTEYLTTTQEMAKNNSGSNLSRSISRVSFRQLLRHYLRTCQEIAEVHVNRSQFNGEPDLTNVQVVNVGKDYAEFRQVDSSFGGRTFIVRFNQITSLELP
jgi:hypothetical protein